MLAQEVTRVFNARGWDSYNQAQVATRIPASTLQRLKKGANVKAATVFEFAEAIGEDRAYWGLIALGMPPDRPPVKHGEEDSEIERVREPEADEPQEESRIQWIAAYDDLPIKIRDSIKAQIDATLEQMYQQRTDIVGKRTK